MNIKWIMMLWCLIALGCSKPFAESNLVDSKQALPFIEVPAIAVGISKLKYDRKTSLWTLNREHFSGYAIQLYPDSTLQQKFGVVDGKKQGEAKNWYPNGQLKRVANYYRGKLHGEKKSWTSDSTPVLINHYNYYLGKAHGVQKKWYNTGERYQVLHLNMGIEDGIQQAFRKNGDLYANYEARAGRIFGLKRAALCYDLDNEKVQYEK